MKIHEYYNENYFAWQKDIGEFGGWANMTKFAPHIKPSDNVIEFGCGGGYLLSSLVCENKIGVEINPHAREVAASHGITVYDDVANIPDEWADVIISNHALEHVASPLEILCLLHEKLKRNGVIIFVVPCESYKEKYRENDINKHIYTWSPLNLGNLFCAARFDIISCGCLFHKWPPYYQLIAKKLGRQFFEIARIWGFIKRDNVQVKIVATKK